MKAKIEDGCIGCGLCVGTCPEVFCMTGEGVAQVFSQLECVNEASAQEAADGCPVNVIILQN